MKHIKSFLVLAVAILSFSSLNVSAQSYDKASYKAPKNEIERKVFKQINKLNYYGVFDRIAFKVEGDTVTLYGDVIRPTTRKEAESRVEDIAGVSRVVNNIQVLPLSSFDDSIRVNTLRELANAGALYRYFWEPNPSVRIIVNRGHISLEGYVAHRGDYNLMNIIASTVPGAFSVKNNLIIERETNR
jgi:hypothetical protein